VRIHTDNEHPLLHRISGETFRLSEQRRERDAPSEIAETGATRSNDSDDAQPLGPRDDFGLPGAEGASLTYGGLRTPVGRSFSQAVLDV